MWCKTHLLDTRTREEALLESIVCLGRPWVTASPGETVRYGRTAARLRNVSIWRRCWGVRGLSQKLQVLPPTAGSAGTRSVGVIYSPCLGLRKTI